MISWLFGLLIIGLVALYVVNPPIRRVTLSAARFLTQLPDRPRPRKLRFSLRRLVSTPLFWLQLLVLLLLLVAALAWRNALAAELGPRRIALLLAVDTSASMSALQNSLPRLAAAQLQAVEAMNSAQVATRGGSWCARLATFDAGWRDLGTFRDITTAAAALDSLVPRALATDLDLVRRNLETSTDGTNEECAPSHIVVITDQPVPTWYTESSHPLIWLDIGQVLPNVGFTAITPVRNALTGAVESIGVQVGAFGPAPTSSVVTITGPGGFALEREHTWGQTIVWEFRFAPLTPGTYTLTLSPDGVYALDDTATLLVSAPRPVRIDWRLSDRTAPDALGWQQDQSAADVRVLSQPDLTTLPAPFDTPLLVVGPGYAPGPNPMLVGYFDEASPLLADLNLDVAEGAGMQPAPPLPDDFLPVLKGADQAVWIAARRDNSAVYIPGPPQFSDDNLGAFSQTVFFNALRVLLDRRDFPELYSLTDLADPEPAGNRLALHPGESDTGREPLSAGRLDDWGAGAAAQDSDQLWPPLLAAALVALALERTAALIGGQRWT